ncbi:MAG: hypothetical protein ACRERC_16045, partial [Candidatus Binatia bacterium]
GHNRPLTVVAPLAAERAGDPAALLDTIRTWAAHGATAFHVSFQHRSAADLIELLERFAVDVVALTNAERPAATT